MVENNEALGSFKDDEVAIAREAKIVARPSPAEDDGTLGVLVAMASNSNPIPFQRGQIDTAAPIKSVKAAVSKFGGIVDWKAHRVQTVERRKFIAQELEKARDGIPSYKKQYEAAEDLKNQVLKELDDTKMLVEELKLNLERAYRDEQQAKQDSELTKLRVDELEQGIADGASFAAKAQLEVARARHAAALSELNIVKDELEQLRKDYSLLAMEKDAAIKNAEESISRSKEIEKSIDDLALEVIIAKESLDSARAAHLEAEECRIEAIRSKELDNLNREKDMKQAEEELQRLEKKKDLKSKLDAATALLEELKSEKGAYMESKLKMETDEEGNYALQQQSKKKTSADIEVMISAANNELEELKHNIEKANSQVKILKEAASSLVLDLEQEKSELVAVQEREGIASVAFASLEVELTRTKSEIALIQMKENGERKKMVELPKRVQEAAEEADQAKGLAETAREELQRAKNEAEQGKLLASIMERRLLAAQKEIKAARVSEKLALAAMSALEKSESSRRINTEDPPSGVELSFKEYYELSKKAYLAEEQANERVAAALSEIEVAKESELRSLNKLEEVSCELSERKSALEAALDKADKAKEGKLNIEQELRKWRSEHEERRRKAGESIPAAVKVTKSATSSFEEPKQFKNITRTTESSSHWRSSSCTSNPETGSSPPVKVTKKKKKSLFPRIFMFLSRKKTHSSKSS